MEAALSEVSTSVFLSLAASVLRLHDAEFHVRLGWHIKCKQTSKDFPLTSDLSLASLTGMMLACIHICWVLHSPSALRLSLLLDHVSASH